MRYAHISAGTGDRARESSTIIEGSLASSIPSHARLEHWLGGLAANTIRWLDMAFKLGICTKYVVRRGFYIKYNP